MAKLTGPLMSVTASGSVGPLLTFSERKSGSQVRYQKKQTYFETVKRTAHTIIYNAGVAMWNTLGADIQAEYDALAVGKKMSGYNLFMQDFMLGMITAGYLAFCGAAICGRVQCGKQI